jgi:hypothetical protein
MIAETVFSTCSRNLGTLSVNGGFLPRDIKLIPASQISFV